MQTRSHSSLPQGVEELLSDWEDIIQKAATEEEFITKWASFQRKWASQPGLQLLTYQA